MAGTLLISQMPSGEGVLIREKVGRRQQNSPEAKRNHRAWGVEPTDWKEVGRGEMRAYKLGERCLASAQTHMPCHPKPPAESHY